MELLEVLRSRQDTTYQSFQRRLIPNIPPETILGVRTPELKAIAREMEDGDVFLAALPHGYFEENQVHAFLLERRKDFQETLRLVEDFLPHIDNWATCDQLRPKVFAKHPDDLLPHIRRWLASSHTYTVRFGVGMLMCHYLDGNFRPEHLDMVATVQSEEYYINMMLAWYFATALAKQWDAALPYIEDHRLPAWVHNKTIQKAVESYRISPEQKTQLRQFRLKT